MGFWLAQILNCAKGTYVEHRHCHGLNLQVFPIFILRVDCLYLGLTFWVPN